MIIKFNQYINESVYVDKFLQLYDLASDELKDEIDKTKNLEQNPFWHPEIYVYTHIRLVTNRLENCYHDINLTLSGFFHDLGKTYTTYFNDKKGSWSSGGHEDVSVKIVHEYEDWIKEMGGDLNIIEFTVANHMRYKEIDKMRISEQKWLISHELFPYVQKFATADYGGHDLICKPIEKHIDILKKIEDVEMKENRKKEISNKFNGRMVMDKYPQLKGPLLGITLNNFKNTFDNFDDYVLSHTTEEIMDNFDNFMNK